MSSRLKFIERVIRPSITNERELAAYVMGISLLCLVIALAADVLNQMIFFVDWSTSVRSWTITAALVLVLTIPTSRTIGKAHLELYRAKLRVDELSHTDCLTGLANRRAFIETAEAETSESMTLVIVDIDQFKRVNDTHGHLAGDIVIKSVGQIMAAELGAVGRISRIGGEEFALLSDGEANAELVSRLCAFRDRIQSTPIVVGGSVIHVTISAGVAVLTDGHSFARLYSEADRALYTAKTGGRNRIRFSKAFASRYGERAQDESLGWQVKASRNER